MRVPLTQGAYTTQSIIGSCQRNVNLYGEKNPPDALAPYTFYGAPGLTPISGSFGRPGRGLYQANNNSLYYVVGNELYLVGPPPSWSLSLIGTIGTVRGPVSMADNFTTMVLVDGSIQGWRLELASNTFAQINAANSSPPPTSTFAFYGADRVDAIDGFLIFNQPTTRNFYSTYLNEVVFDSLFFAAKNGYSDVLVTLIITRREIWLLGQRTTELWFDSGDAAFPFQIIPGPFIQHGCLAKASVATVNGAIFWLAQDQAGKAQIVRAEGYIAKPISNQAIENELASYPNISDAEGFCFTMNGHTFYQLNFPTADKSWRWDDRTPEIWHEALWTDGNGQEHRHRASCTAYAYGFNVCADWETGQLYTFDMENHTDAGMPMIYRRGFPHMMSDGKRVIYPGLTVDVQAATSTLYTTNQPGPFQGLAGPGGVGGTPSFDAGESPRSPGNTVLTEEALFMGKAPPPSTAPTIWMRYSDDRGRTWSNPLPQSLGASGEYLVQPQYNRLGSSRDRVFELFGVIPGKLALNGVFLDPPPIAMNN